MDFARPSLELVIEQWVAFGKRQVTCKHDSHHFTCGLRGRALVLTFERRFTTFAGGLEATVCELNYQPPRADVVLEGEVDVEEWRVERFIRGVRALEGVRIALGMTAHRLTVEHEVMD